MNAAGMTWGWFQGGFRPTSVDGGGDATCGASTRTSPAARRPTTPPTTSRSSTTPRRANRHHLPPTSVAMIGHDRPGQPPVRPHGLRRGGRGGQPAAGVVPQGRARSRTATPATPTRWTSSASSPASLDEIQQSPDWADDRDRHHLRRLRRLVRPQACADQPALARPRPTPLDGPGSCGAAPARRRLERPLRPRARACRCSSSRRGRQPNYVDQHASSSRRRSLKFIEDNWVPGRHRRHSRSTRAPRR